MCRSNINSLQFNRFGWNKVFDNPPKSAMNHGPWIFWIIYRHESFRPWWIDSREAGVRSIRPSHKYPTVGDRPLKVRSCNKNLSLSKNSLASLAENSVIQKTLDSEYLQFYTISQWWWPTQFLQTTHTVHGHVQSLWGMFTKKFKLLSIYRNKNTPEETRPKNIATILVAMSSISATIEFFEHCIEKKIWEPFKKCILCCFCLHWSLHLYLLFWNEETLWNQPITN